MSSIYVRTIPVTDEVRKSESPGTTGFLVIGLFATLLAMLIGTFLYLVADAIIPYFFTVSSRSVLIGVVFLVLFVLLVAVISSIIDSARIRKSGMLDWIEIWEVDADEAVGNTSGIVLLGCGDKTLSVCGEWWANEFVEKWEEWRVLNRVPPDTFFPESRFSIWLYPKGTGRLHCVKSTDSPPLKIRCVENLEATLSALGYFVNGNVAIIPMRLSDIVPGPSSKA